VDEEVDGVEAETVDAALQPETHGGEVGVHDRGVVEIEVGCSGRKL
jgi:hypothetical protein